MTHDYKATFHLIFLFRQLQTNRTIGSKSTCGSLKANTFWGLLDFVKHI